ncbi:hypothetical protein [Flavobacterium sp. CAU 1735]|uniref:hypothetical protein n=1 Tax=Flavobacterium sp. CAU 1735 TaxID=3140361 RepID=UPI0032613008
MSAIKEFNDLNGKEVSRVYLTGLISRGRKEKNTEVVSRLSGLLKNNPGIDRFVIKITNQIKENPPAEKNTKPKLVNHKSASKQPIAKPSRRILRKPKRTGLNSPEGVQNSNLSALEKMGFVMADKAPEKAEGIFQLPGDIGKFIQEIQPHKALILIKGTKHTSKSQLAMQIANAFGEMGEPVAYIDYEQGGMDSKDTIASLNRNSTPAGRKNIAVIGFLENPMVDLKKFCGHCKVIVADSVTDLGITADQLNELRVNYPKVIWVFISQVRENGQMYGGNKMAHNPTAIIQCHPSPNPEDRYATLEKNRGNDLSLKYSIFHKALIVPIDPNRKLTFNVQ